ncbi:cob(I)yrinic acid a,c-diamide adenosyltransferase, partial [Bacillus sp. JJ722]|uniref:cob(I)yrinic acid a,c-diamide adenosyltransferase n=1 Tax=Bacillus sp. JJ722 TaxID=3122973 RepID=UPI002FFF3A45
MGKFQRIKAFTIDDVIPLTEVLYALQNKPKSTHVIITGRDAKQAIKDIADLVSNVHEDKHYYQVGVQAIYPVQTGDKTPTSK